MPATIYGNFSLSSAVFLNDIIFQVAKWNYCGNGKVFSFFLLACLLASCSSLVLTLHWSAGGPSKPALFRICSVEPKEYAEFVAFYAFFLRLSPFHSCFVEAKKTRFFLSFIEPKKVIMLKKRNSIRRLIQSIILGNCCSFVQFIATIIYSRRICLCNLCPTNILPSTDETQTKAYRDYR